VETVCFPETFATAYEFTRRRTLNNNNVIFSDQIYLPRKILECNREVQESLLDLRKVYVKIYKTIILPVVLYGCETLSLALREEHRPRVFEQQGSEKNIWT
jgi:hypothetical protein